MQRKTLFLAGGIQRIQRQSQTVAVQSFTADQTGFRKDHQLAAIGFG
ncbi:hypothetical protein SDC9_156762 [bioreactor metagenome]|uniref:Uncharacterized protein n=1 Tax=bioreactor metagenome TaxID=1076179 RepID=A0A645F7G8_9ZZZZ